MQPSAENSHRHAFTSAGARDRAALLGVLADGAWHSEDAVARIVDAEPARIRDEAARLSRMGLDIEFNPQSRVRLSRPLDLLSSAQLRVELSADILRRVSSLEVFLELDSTNAHLLGSTAPAPGYVTAVLADYQHAGRGRRGRNWNMPLGSGIGLSAGWTFPDMPRDLPSLSLAAGVVTRRVIEALCGCAPALKWPNDLVWNHRKLGGILVETAAGRNGVCHVVIGVGLNVSMDSGQLDAVGEHAGAAVDLARMSGARPPPRHMLAARLIEGYSEMFMAFADAGFGAYHASFVEADYLRDRPVVVTDGASRVEGTAVAIDADGALILETESGPRRIVSGDVSVRAVC